MKTIKLEVNNKIYDKLIQILNQFNSKDLKVIEDELFEQNKIELQEQYKELSNSNAEYISIDELENMLEETIAKYGN